MAGSWAMNESQEVEPTIPYGLSTQQFSAVIGTQNVFIQACPGSGKTRSVAARVAWMQQEKKSMALLSFTRVGAEEIARAASLNHGVTIAGENFVGTIQSFLQKYVLTPFAHLITGSKRGVRIDPVLAEALDPAGLSTSDYHFGIDGTIKSKKQNSAVSDHLAEQISNAKKSTANQGFVGLEDDVYWSFKTLVALEEVRKAVAGRFDEIIVDEAQDLDSLQIECLRLLKNAGLNSLVLVGDYDQTIYEWRGSNPLLCEKFAKDVGLISTPLTENYRSSQVICNLAANFRFNAIPDIAVGKNRECTIPPLIIKYRPGEENSLPHRLKKLTEQYGIIPESQAVLVRSQALKKQIAGVNTPTIQGALKTLLSVKQATDGPSLDHYKEVERILIRRAFGSSYPESTLESHLIRTVAMSVIDKLPPLEGNLLDWAKAATSVMDTAIQGFVPSPVHSAKPVSLPDRWREIQVAKEPAQSSSDIRIDTVFAFKGESVDAVMLVAGDPSPSQKRWGHGNAVSWSGHLNSGVAKQDEETRVAFVAITRSQRFFVLALPDDTSPEILKNFENVGFQISCE